MRAKISFDFRIDRSIIQSKTLCIQTLNTIFEMRNSQTEYQSVVEIAESTAIYVVFGGNAFRCFRLMHSKPISLDDTRWR